MSGDLVRITPSGVAESISLLPGVIELAKQVATTNFVPKAYRGRPAEITAAILYGHEIGISAMTALQQIAVVDGRPAPSAQLGVALALAAGHEVWVADASTTRVTVSGRRRGSSDVQSVTWTMDDAKRAGLDRKDNWRQYPRAMLTHRAQAELVRNLCPDVLGGIAVFAEELDGDEQDPQAVDDDTKTTKRRRRTPAKTPEPVAEPTHTEPEAGQKGPPEPEHPAEPAALNPATTEPAEAPDVDLNAPPPRLNAPEAPTAPIGPSAAQMKAMHASLGDAGFTERDDRLAFVSAVAGRTVESSKDLTKAEAGAVIDAAQRLATGELGLLLEEDGSWTLIATESEA
jgi:hypothetical protein